MSFPGHRTGSFLLYGLCTGLNLEDRTCGRRCKLAFDVLSYSIFVSQVSLLHWMKKAMYPLMLADYLKGIITVFDRFSP